MTAIPDQPMLYDAGDNQPNDRQVALELDALFADPRRPPAVGAVDEACRGSLTGLYDWCAATFRFLLVTAEMTEALAAELRAAGARSCVEVGAGRGELSLALDACRVPCIPTDDYSWTVRPKATGGIYAARVRRLGHREALDLLRPDTVICAWMPNREDWTPDFRAAASVRRYVLLGTGPHGEVATPVAWDCHAGWMRRALPAVEAGARCRVDSLLGTRFARHRSVVVSWEREQWARRTGRSAPHLD